MRRGRVAKLSNLEAIFALQLKALDCDVVREYRFALAAIGNPKEGIRAKLKKAGLKDWRFDFAFKREKLAVEIEGGVFTGGRHTRPTGFIDDTHKYNAAVLLGWRVLRFAAPDIKSGEALGVVDQALEVGPLGLVGKA